MRVELQAAHQQQGAEGLLAWWGEGAHAAPTNQPTNDLVWKT